MVSYIYEISATANNKVNLEKLKIEVTLSTVHEDNVYLFNGKIYVDVDAEITQIQKDELDAIIIAHDGAEALAMDVHKIDERDLKVKTLIQQAIYHSGIDTVQMVEYLTSIDNYINGYIRSGIDDVFVAKVTADKDVSSFSTFLNQVVNSQGVLMYEYIIGGITA